MNTISNPLVLTYREGYKVNKPGEQSGEYVDKQVAVDLLEAILACEVTLKAFLPDAFATISLVETAIKKAKCL